MLAWWETVPLVTSGSSGPALLTALAAASLFEQCLLFSERERNSYRQQHSPWPVCHLPLWFPGGFLLGSGVCLGVEGS